MSINRFSDQCQSSFILLDFTMDDEDTVGCSTGPICRTAAAKSCTLRCKPNILISWLQILNFFCQVLRPGLVIKCWLQVATKILI